MSSKICMSGKPGFTEVTSIYIQWLHDTQEGYAMDCCMGYSPSLDMDALEREFWQDSGWTHEAWKAEAARRGLSNKWMYQNGI